MSSRQVSAATFALFALLISGVIWWLGWKPESENAVGQIPLTSPGPTIPKQAVKISSSLNWEELSEPELRDFASRFGKTLPTSFDTDVHLEPGESLLADAFEARPGEFVFSRITPTRKTLEDGTSVIEVTLDCFSMSLTGEHRQILSRTCELKPHGTYINSAHVEDGVYSLATSAGSGYEGGEIHLKASGGFQALKVP